MQFLKITLGSRLTGSTFVNFEYFKLFSYFVAGYQEASLRHILAEKIKTRKEVFFLTGSGLMV